MKTTEAAIRQFALQLRINLGSQVNYLVQGKGPYVKGQINGLNTAINAINTLLDVTYTAAPVNLTPAEQAKVKSWITRLDELDTKHKGSSTASVANQPITARQVSTSYIAPPKATRVTPIQIKSTRKPAQEPISRRQHHAVIVQVHKVS